jgi:hypothetical protein
MNGAAFALSRAEWQPLLFNVPNRADLNACVPTWPLRTIRVRVHRNHGFEAVSTATPAYAAWNGLAFQWLIGTYDDSLSFHLEDDADVEIVWMDTTRIAGLGEGDIGDWLAARLRVLRAKTSHPVIVLAWPLAEADHQRLNRAAIPGVCVVDLAPIRASLRSVVRGSAARRA